MLGYALITGLAVRAAPRTSDDLKVFDVAPQPPPPLVEKVVPRPAKSRKPEGAASPPNLKAKATEIVAPRPVVPPLVPPRIVAALKPGTGAAPSAGASDVAGPGTGAGGEGTGTGSGGNGYGEGDGGDETPPRKLRGRLNNSDYPRAAGEAGIGGTVSVRYFVETNGRVTQCSVTRSSGNVELDRYTCRLIEERFRYEPSRDAGGRAVRSIIVENQSWVIHAEPASQN